MIKKIFLLFIVVLAFFLRVYKLGEYPVGFLWDEAALGYNAYSILETGKDEYGEVLPLIFKSFGDYKPGFYVYLTVPSVVVFGLNEFAVRLPSALAGVATVMLLYFLIRRTLGNENIALFTSLVLAINPWHINFSRGAWELNLMVFEIILGLYLLIEGIDSKKRIYLLASATIFLLSLFTYQIAKLLMPALLIGFFYLYRKKLFLVDLKPKIIFLTIVVGGFVIFNLMTMLGGKAGRLKVMSVFSYPRSEEETRVLLNQDNGSKLDYALFHSPPVYFLRSVLGRYFNYFSGKFLFIEGDWSNIRNGTVFQGVLYYLDLLFLLIGIGVLLAKKRQPFENFILFWLVVAPLPAALTRDSISAIRSFSMIIPLTIIIAVGLKRLFEEVKKFGIIRHICYGAIAAVYLLLFVRFLDLYFVHDAKYSSQQRLYGYKEAVFYVNKYSVKKNKIIFSNKYGQPYIFYLFYTKYPPGDYQKQAKLKENPYGDVGEVEKLDNIEFKKIYFPSDRSNHNSLFVGDEFDLQTHDIVGQEGIVFVKEIKFPDNKTAFRIVETQ